MILLSGSSSVINSPENTNQEIKSDVSQEPISAQIQSLNVELDDISIKEVTPRGATIEISFKINNPNSNSVIVQVMDYQLFETGYSNVEQISGGQIGSRPEGMVEFGSDYYVLLAENSIILKDKIQLKNTGNTPKLWSDLENDTAKWRVTGTVFYNLSSMTSGQENTLHFEFEK
ncbi:hypothetical protein [Nitrosarchaeum sp. AC2]|uniref:hypothetical protein n=1 Tax=Nitrosarchaeum sp. AC2 TaxID=2259673 RepID=UPI0021062708|nr:hypothetical protein [Nitrosarchaeum sp. AC2]